MSSLYVWQCGSRFGIPISNMSLCCTPPPITRGAERNLAWSCSWQWVSFSLIQTFTCLLSPQLITLPEIIPFKNDDVKFLFLSYKLKHCKILKHPFFWCMQGRDLGFSWGGEEGPTVSKVPQVKMVEKSKMGVGGGAAWPPPSPGYTTGM